MQLAAMPGVQVIQAFYSPWETKTKGLQVQGRDPGAYRAIICNYHEGKPCLRVFVESLQRPYNLSPYTAQALKIKMGKEHLQSS